MTRPSQLRCVMAQLNMVVGAVEGNTSRIIAAANQAREQSAADLVMLPELAVSGYPPEDLLFHSGMRSQVARSIGRLKAEVRGITLIAGYPEYEGNHIYNSALVLRDSNTRAWHLQLVMPSLSTSANNPWADMFAPMVLCPTANNTGPSPHGFPSKPEATARRSS